MNSDPSWFNGRLQRKRPRRAPVITAATSGIRTQSHEELLLIDLPEGPKLVMHALPANSVIEIASWRGIGNPDSRTSRILIGTAVPELAPQARAHMPAAEDSPVDTLHPRRRRRLLSGVGLVLSGLVLLIITVSVLTRS